MRFNKGGVDRLLPRHQPESPLRLDWNVRMVRRRLVKKEEDFAPGEIVDVSLDGALVEVVADQRFEVGDRVSVRFRGVPGHAEVRHRGVPEHAEGKTLYGIRFLQDHEFRQAITEAVSYVRGRQAELDEAWSRVN